MQQYETPADESDGSIDLNAAVFGVDRRGDLHRYDGGDIVVTRDGELKRVERDVGRDGVDRWISYVGQERGWIDVWWHAQGVDTITRLGNALKIADQLQRQEGNPDA